VSTLSQYQTSLCIAASLLAVVCGWSSSSVAKERYNVWAKEKIRVHRDRVNQFPNNAELRVVLGTAYYEDGNLREAEVHLKRAIEIKSDYPEAHCNLGIVYQAWAHRSEAERHYREALRQDSTLIEAMAGLGTLLCASNRHAQGIQHLEGVLRLDVRRDDARFNLGVAYHKVGDHIRAIEHLGDLLKRRQDYPGARHGLAQAHLARGLMYLQAELLQPALDQFQFSLRQV
ncbi:uncharacterized protein METZ01_LOCUS382740, partial [marine metagenome]